jgi:hypothetical protein
MQARVDNVIGWGVDRRPEDRPGVPRQIDPPRRMGGAAPGGPEQQVVGEVNAIDERRPITPVYATANPPRGLSGLLRRAAYTIPPYKARRWMLLMFADRIDVFEHGAGRPLAVLLGGAALAAGTFVAVRAIRA